MTDLSSPGELMVEIERAARSLDATSRKIADLERRYPDIDLRYQRARAEAMIELELNYLEKNEKMPAADLREAHVFHMMPAEIIEARETHKHHIDALKAWARGTEASLSARQTLLNVLKAELRAS
jgi:hypothetical protein